MSGFLKLLRESWVTEKNTGIELEALFQLQSVLSEGLTFLGVKCVCFYLGT